MEHNTNPLSKYFRQPAIYLKLPSGGNYWPEGSINLPDNREIPIFPMTASDEITLKTPDALLNGQGVVNVVQSCCPNIVDAWQAPSLDMDSILIAIRIATYGNNMPFTSKCPKCSEEHEYELPLDRILASVEAPDFETPVLIDSLTIKLRPQAYSSVNSSNMINFEEQRILQTINDESIDDQTRKAQFDDHLKRLVNLNITIIANGTASIATPDGVIVTDRSMIEEFYAKTGSKVLKEVQERFKKINDLASLKPQEVQCTACKHEFKIPVEFDYAHFFG